MVRCRGGESELLKLEVCDARGINRNLTKQTLGMIAVQSAKTCPLLESAASMGSVAETLTVFIDRPRQGEDQMACFAQEPLVDV